jgi:hypothetical protein
MSGRRGRSALTISAIDHGWPHQVALPEPAYVGRNFTIVHGFIEAEGLSLARLGHGFFRDGVHYHVFCFAEREHAARFHAKFGGEMMSPETRPRWPNKPSLAERRSKWKA